MTAPVPGKFSLFSVMDGAARTIVRDFPSYFKLALASFLFCWGFSAVQSGTEPGAGATSGILGYYPRFLLVLTMTFLLSAFMVPLMAGMAALGFVFAGLGADSPARVLRGAAVTMITFTVLGYWAVALSTAYRQVTGWTPPEGEKNEF
ncbi:MAG: hypothetical protein QGF09_17770 [Rhodospirillales bacterium]|nr:hypothetical protein [Rhodospirillales bacterium]